MTLLCSGIDNAMQKVLMDGTRARHETGARMAVIGGVW
jgi:hypothetical protein